MKRVGHGFAKVVICITVICLLAVCARNASALECSGKAAQNADISQILASWQRIDDLEREGRSFAEPPCVASGSPFRPGQLTSEYQQAWLALVNAFRAASGQPALTLAEEKYQLRTQAAAAACAYRGELSHDLGPIPDASAADFKTARFGCAESMLVFRYNANDHSAADGTVDLLADLGPWNLLSGHSQKLLGDCASIAFGAAQNGDSYYYTVAVYGKAAVENDWFSFPGRVFAAQWLAGANWYLCLEDCDPRRLADLEIRVTEAATGKVWTFDSDRVTLCEGGYSGRSCALLFQPDSLLMRAGEYRVEAAGLYTREGQPVEIAYTTCLFDLAAELERFDPAQARTGTARAASPACPEEPQEEIHLRPAPDLSGGSAVGFRDVAQSAYYRDAVVWAVEKGITAGVSSQRFGSEEKCTRGQAVTFLWRAAGSPRAEQAANPFTDVKEGDFYYDAVLWAVESGITTGLDGTHFGPAAKLTRGQFVTFLWRAMGRTAPAAPAGFSDVGAGSYCAEAVAWAVENGITAGAGNGTFAPDAKCTRAQVVTFLARAYK